MNPTVVRSRFNISRLLATLGAWAFIGIGAAHASSYYVVVPLTGKTSDAVKNIAVSLASYTLPQALVGQPYPGFDFNSVVSVTGDPGYSGYGLRWSVSAGSLPAGLTLDASTGKLSGTPTAPGTSDFQVMASYKTKAGSQAYQLVTLSITVSLASAQLPAARVGVAYPGFDFSQVLTVTGDPDFDSGKVQYAATNLPEGMTLAGSVLSGTPTSANTAGGSFQMVASYRGIDGPQTYTIVVNEKYLTGVTRLVAGGHHVCALMSTGGVKCWGQNNFGQLGNNGSTDSSLPVDVVGLSSGVATIAAGNNHTCAVTNAGAALCWGYNAYGQLGNGTTTDSHVPIVVPGLASGIADISAGQLGHTCAVTTAGGVKCWRQNNYGQLGDGTKNDSLVPLDVPGLTGVARVVNGEWHTCVVTQTGGMKCWGANGSGQLGNNSTAVSLVPVIPNGLSSGVVQIGLGANFTCARTTAGAAMCWGYNVYGMVGNGTTTDSHVPVTVAGLSSGVSDIAAFGDVACALSGAGPVCWGLGSSGSLGNGTTSNSSVPVAVAGMTVAPLRIIVGSVHTCALATNSRVQCWGTNSHGELGNHTKATSLVPVDVVNP